MALTSKYNLILSACFRSSEDHVEFVAEQLPKLAKITHAVTYNLLRADKGLFSIFAALQSSSSLGKAVIPLARALSIPSLLAANRQARNTCLAFVVERLRKSEPVLTTLPICGHTCWACGRSHPWPPSA